MEKVYTYKQQSVLLLALVSLVVAAGWVAFIYLAIPRVWEWATEGLIPYSQCSMAPWEDVLAWGVAGVYLVMAVVVAPLMRAFGAREVALSERGVVFRGRGGQETCVMSRVTAITTKKRVTKIVGSSPQGNQVRRVVRQNLLGKAQYRDFQDELHRLLSTREDSS